MKKTFGVMFIIVCMVAIIIGGTWLIGQVGKEFRQEIGPHKPANISNQFTVTGVVTLRSSCYYELIKKDGDEVIRSVVVAPEIGETNATFEIKEVDLSGTYNFGESSCSVSIFSKDNLEITAQMPFILIAFYGTLAVISLFVILCFCGGGIVKLIAKG